MNRRQATKIILAALTSAPLLVRAQERTRIPIIAVPLLFADANSLPVEALRAGLKERGWIDGENIRIEHRSAQGKIERMPEMIVELVRLKPDVYVGAALPIVRALQKVVGNTPIIVVGWDFDPVAEGLVASLSRPGGRMTGVYSQSLETSGKRLELLKDLLPGLKKVAVLYDRFGLPQLEHFKAGAKVLGMLLQPIEIADPYDYEKAFKQAVTERAGAMAVAFSPKFFADRERIAQVALKFRMPTVYDEDSRVDAGGLMSYGPERRDMWGRMGYFIDRILKGTPPSELPVEQPTHYRLWLNLKTAKVLNIKVPESIMVRADRVIR